VRKADGEIGSTEEDEAGAGRRGIARHGASVVPCSVSNSEPRRLAVLGAD
jgi:hypothetical protein